VRQKFAAADRECGWVVVSPTFVALWPARLDTSLHDLLCRCATGAQALDVYFPGVGHYVFGEARDVDVGPPSAELVDRPGAR